MNKKTSKKKKTVLAAKSKAKKLLPINLEKLLQKIMVIAALKIKVEKNNE